MDAMNIWSKLTPDARSALNSLPLQTVARADELTHEDQVTRIASLVDKYIEPCFDRETFDMYRASKNLCDERPEFWSRLFAGLRPERQEMLPSVAQYEHMRLLDLRPVKPVGDVEQALKAKPRDQALDDFLFKILSKPMAPLHRMIIPALELVSMPDLTAEYDDDFDPEIKRALSASSSLLRSFALHTLALHSDLMHRRKILALTALGVSKHEAEGVRNVLDSWDRAKLKALAEERKERIILAGNLKRKAPEGGKRKKGGVVVATTATATAVARMTPRLSSREARVLVVTRPSSRQRRVLRTAPTSLRVPRGRSPSSGGKTSKSP